MDRSGLTGGDVIVEFDGQQVTSPTALQSAVDARRPGEKVSIIVLRGGHRRTLERHTRRAPVERLSRALSDNLDQGLVSTLTARRGYAQISGRYEEMGKVRPSAIRLRGSHTSL